MEVSLKTLGMLVVVLAAVGGAGFAGAESPESGFFIGGGGHIQMIKGTGTWAEYDFKIDNPLSVDEGDAVGFAWTDRVLLGLKPMVGYRLSPQLELQVAYGLNITKSSQQSDNQYDGFTSYEQGFSLAWQQRSVEIVGVYFPDPETRYFFYGGLDMTHIKADFTFYEGVGYEDYFGNPVSEVDSEKIGDSISATGIILGAGIEFPSDGNLAVFASAQYSTAKTKDIFFGTEDFKVGVGGITLMIGVKWFAFNKENE